MFASVKKIATVAACLCAMNVYANSYPNKPIHLIVPYAAGGGTDIAARMLAAELSKRIKQSVVVENKAGAATQIGTSYVVRAPADGYTLLMGAATLGTNPSLYSSLPYDTLTDLVPIVQVTDVPVYLFAHEGSNIKKAEDLLNNKDQTINYATAGVGSIPHLTAELVAKSTQVPLEHVPYKGSSEAVIAVSSGQVPLSFDNLAPTLAQVKADRLKPLAIASKQRNPAFADVPTLDELGYPIVASSWWGVLAPKNTPTEVIEFINREVNEVLKQPNIRTYYEEQGIFPVGGTQQEFAAHIQNQITTWGELIKETGISLQQSP